MNHPQIEVKYKKTRGISKEMLADLYSSKEKLEDFIEEMEILSDPELNDYKKQINNLRLCFAKQ
ncbi:MAG: hypothetical protein ACE5J3_03230 [Methanosarcinales archaeon]